MRMLMLLAVLLLAGCPPRQVRTEDPDRDGIFGAVDACPGVPEDRDGYQDEDGCPEGNPRE